MITAFSVSFLLLFAILLLSPRRPLNFRGSSAAEVYESKGSRHFVSRKETDNPVKEKWSIVIDAGSTGSRIHVFKFKVDEKQNLVLVDDKFEQLKPGLSAYSEDPDAAASSLKPLLEVAMSSIPKSFQSSTSIMVGATAGLRLLPDGKADLILEKVRSFLGSFPFKLGSDDVRILSGVDEGAYSWLTLNYLLGKLGLPYSETVAAIDLGGGSVQEAYALGPNEAADAPKSDYIKVLNGGGRQYDVYVHSYLGYGLMAARAAILEEDLNGPEDESHPCVHGGFIGLYEYGGRTFPATAHSDGAEHEKCIETVASALKQEQSCGAPVKQCSFGGAWAGPRIPSVFYVSSYFWDRAADAGLVDDDVASQAVLKPQYFEEVAKKACPLRMDELKNVFPRVVETHRPYFCLDLTYAHTLLVNGFKIPNHKEIVLVKRVEYEGRLVEAAWPLGAAINTL